MTCGTLPFRRQGASEAMPIPVIETLVFDDEDGAMLDWHGLSRYQVLEAFADAAGV